MKHIFYVFSIMICLFSCKNKEIDATPLKNENLIDKHSIAYKISNLKDSKNKDIIVVAHRGDWRNAPENSLQAIQSCIYMGVDMVEIDVRETKDGHLVLMHDETIDRTTTGKGFVNEWTLDSLKTLYLTDGLGSATKQKIPTLEEALMISKDKILINLDKSYPIFDKCFKIVEKTGTANQVVIKGDKTKDEVEQEFGQYLSSVHFMPIIRLPNENAKKIIADYLASPHPPVAFEFLFESDTLSLIKDFGDLRKNGSGVWVNSLWSELCGGHDDEKAILDKNVYQWYIDNNIDMIQTDRPQHLLNFLRSKGLHN